MEEAEMRIDCLAYALVFGSIGGFAAHAQSLPQFDISATCRTAQPLTAEDRDPVQSCMREETAAERQLQQVWGTAPAAQRETCAGETQVGGFPSYVDVLTCLQMYQGATSTASPRRRRQP
jgi:hypothetical protein